MTARPVVLYAPTLRSAGGITAARLLTDQLVDWSQVRGAVCSPELARALRVDTSQGDRELAIDVVDGQRAGARAIAGVGVDATVLCLQNPAIVPAGLDVVTIVQNHAALHPAVAALAGRSWFECSRYPKLAALTALQLRRSRIWYSLNSRVPAWARQLGTWGGVVTNAAALDGTPPPQLDLREPGLVVWVGSWWGFRRPLLAMDAFAASALPAQGARLRLLAADGDQAVRARAHERAAGLRAFGIDVSIIEGESPTGVQAHLSSAPTAIFTSAVEGSPVAFVEACRLAGAVVAPALADFTESIPTGTEGRVHLAASSSADAFAGALNRAMA